MDEEIERNFLKTVKHLWRLAARETRQQAIEDAARVVERMPKDASRKEIAATVRLLERENLT